MYSLNSIEHIVKVNARLLPLDIFALLGSFIEEIIPPIPAPLIMTTAGSIALSQHHIWIFLVWLAIVGAIGKTFASWIFYLLGDRLEHIILGKFGKFFGINQEDVEHLGKRFNGGWGDDIALFTLRSIPVFPSVSVSIICGIISLNMRTFIVATFLGTIVKNMIYLYIGYAGMQAVSFFVRKLHSIHFIGGLVSFVVAAVAIYILVHKKKKTVV